MRKNGIVKHIIIAAALLLGVSQSFAGGGGVKVPRKVQRQFDAMYPQAQQVDWSKNHGFEADFRVQDKTASLVFDRKGDVRYSKIDINLNQLPVPVTNSLNGGFVGQGFQPEFATHRWSEKSGESYDILVNKGREEYVLRYSPTGNLITQFDVSKQDKQSERIYFDD